MVNAISGLGDRLASHVAHDDAFAAHAAHALRTPLAGMDAQLAVAIRQCDPAVRAGWSKHVRRRPGCVMLSMP